MSEHVKYTKMFRLPPSKKRRTTPSEREQVTAITALKTIISSNDESQEKINTLAGQLETAQTTAQYFQAELFVLLYTVGEYTRLMYLIIDGQSLSQPAVRLYSKIKPRP